MMRTMNTIFRWTCLLTAACCLSGCAASSNLPGAPLHIAILSDGVASVDGRRVEIPKLGKKLKSLGATANTTLYIAVPADVSSAVLTDVTRTLASAGFPKIIFTKPVEKTATVSDKPTPATPVKSTKPAKAKTPTSQKPLRSGTL